jgi:hypothetical protein
VSAQPNKTLPQTAQVAASVARSLDMKFGQLLCHLGGTVLASDAALSMAWARSRPTRLPGTPQAKQQPPSRSWRSC